jgi:BirA family biotin operon repressor/biotin-[acetyl-CoA-carboxylase] ligase
MALFYLLCHDPTAMSLDLEGFHARLRTEALGHTVFHFTSCASTMQEARREAEAGAPDGALVLAGEQTAGRGRMGRSWVSPPGVNIYLTIILRPPLEQLRQLSVIAPLAVSLAVEETTGLFPRLKWPNDVIIDGKKLSGILIESEIVENKVLFALVGVGINVNLDIAAHQEIGGIATSLFTELGHTVARGEVLASFLNHFEPLYQALRRGEVVSMDWKQRLDTLGKPVRIQFPGGAVESGVVVDADSDGSLILRHDDGSYVRIESGEVTLRE